MKPLFAFLFLAALSTSVARDWTSLDGKVIQADLVSATDTAVIISKAGQEFTVPLDRLIEADRTYAREWLEQKAAEMLQLGNEAVTPEAGKHVTFTVSTDPELAAKAAKTGVPNVDPAAFGIAVPDDFDPTRDYPVFVISVTSSGKSPSSIGHMKGYIDKATAAGWVVVGADGPEIPEAEQDSNEYRWAVLSAGLEHLHEKWPNSREWHYACGGNSGGAKRSGFIAAIMSANGYNVSGIYMGGCNHDMATLGLEQYSPPKAEFLKVPIWISSGVNDKIASPEDSNRIAGEMRETGFKNVRVESHDGGHGLSKEHVTEALGWFEEMAAASGE
ncbi:MAG: hypothetical protein HRU46_09845 [Verrucomicrobiales bacterium]|nr:hypothetical protein [Verrucomicrobiales bacterium]